MFNAIRMETFRMFHTKSLYVIWIIMAVFVFLSTFILKQEFAELQKVNQVEQTQSESEQSDNQNGSIGISVEEPETEDGKVTVSGLMSSNLQARVIALFLVIFAVLFVNADSASGYIKNIAGQVSHRNWLVFAKMVPLMVFSVLSMALYYVAQAVASRMFFGVIYYGDVKSFIPYIIAQTLLHFGLIMLSMGVVYLVRSSVWSMIIMIAVCANLVSLLYTVVNTIIYKIGVDNFDIIEYTLTGKIARVSVSEGGITGAVIAAIVYTFVLTVITCVTANKRDVV